MGTGLDEQVRPWTGSLRELQHWRAALLAAPALTHLMAQAGQPWNKAVLFTDASDHGFGAVLFRLDGTTSIIAGRWTKDESNLHINCKEALVVKKALTSLDLRHLVALDLKIDNTSALFTIRSGTSKSHKLNEIVCDIWKVPEYSLIRSIEYVASGKNHADLPSRLRRTLHIESRDPTTLCRLGYLAQMMNRDDCAVASH